MRLTTSYACIFKARSPFIIKTKENTFISSNRGITYRINIPSPKIDARRGNQFIYRTYIVQIDIVITFYRYRQSLN